MLLISAIMQSCIGQGFEQLDLIEDVPAQNRGAGPDDLPTQTTLWKQKVKVLIVILYCLYFTRQTFHASPPHAQPCPATMKIQISFTFIYIHFKYKSTKLLILKVCL